MPKREIKKKEEVKGDLKEGKGGEDIGGGQRKIPNFLGLWKDLGAGGGRKQESGKVAEKKNRWKPKKRKREKKRERTIPASTRGGAGPALNQAGNRQKRGGGGRRV